MRDEAAAVLAETISCEETLKMASKELTAFFRAVTELFGAEQTLAEDWLQPFLSKTICPRPHLNGGRSRQSFRVACRREAPAICASVRALAPGSGNTSSHNGSHIPSWKAGKSQRELEKAPKFRHPDSGTLAQEIDNMVSGI